MIPNTRLRGKLLKSLPLTIGMVKDVTWTRGILIRTTVEMTVVIYHNKWFAIGRHLG